MQYVSIKKYTVEKSTQVRHMLDIYKGADSVVIWLGESAEDSDLAIAGMKFLDEEEHRAAVLLRIHGPAGMNRLRRLYNAEAALFLRPYFHRSWSDRRLQYAKEVSVRCGSSAISWYAVKRSAKRLERIHRKLKNESQLDIPEFDEDSMARLQYLSRWIFGQSVTGYIGEIRSMWYYHAGGLLDLLMAGNFFESTDPRDKVYSLLGLAVFR
jgi:hypothetical protein